VKPKAAVAAEKNVKRQFQDSKDLETWFSRERKKILNFQYQNWPTEEDIELEYSV